MFRLKTVSSLLVYGAATLVFLVFVIHLFPPLYNSSEPDATHFDQQDAGILSLPKEQVQETTSTTASSSTEARRVIAQPATECQQKFITIEQFRTRSIIRGVIVRFPSVKSSYYFVQFRWFYRSWIESEMFTLDRWRTDLLVLIDDRLPDDTRKSLADLNCHTENVRTSQRQTSRCILVNHTLWYQRSTAERQNYTDRYQMLNRTRRLIESIDRLFSIYEYTSQLNRNQTVMYDFIMVTTMNTFLTTQFGKNIPVKCSFLLGASPDYSTWYSMTEQIVEFAHTLLLTLDDPKIDQKTSPINYPLTITTLQNKISFLEGQVDVATDLKITTYRTSIYHLKSFASSTSLFSERMFRNNAYDGHEKEPFNIYIAREYATLMALQSKVMTLNDLRLLAVNVTHREVFT